MTSSYNTYFQKQPLMRKVIYSLIPIIAASIYFFGWRSLVLILTSCFFGVLAEYAFKWRSKKPVTEAVFVSAILYALTLPPSTPLWIAALGIVFGIVFGKEVFGGFGRNVFNPALVGRAFAYVCFPLPLTTVWNENVTGGMGGLLSYSTPVIHAMSSATPMQAFRSSGTLADTWQLFLGNISGSVGETSALLIILAGAYLLYTKTASKENMLGTLIGFLGMNSLLYVSGFESVPNPLFGILSGGVLFGAVFMATDPISSPKTTEAKWFYGILIGSVTVIIRGFALFTEGMMFAILIGNTFAPLMDDVVKAIKASRKTSKGGASKHAES